LIGWRRELRRWSRDPIGYLVHLYDAYGDVSALQTKRLRVFAFGAAQNEQLTCHPTRFRMLPIAAAQPARPQGSDAGREALDCLRSGLLALDGEVHRRHRQAVAPPFRPKELTRHHDTIVAITARLLESWRVGDTFDLEQAMRGLVQRLAMNIVLGVDDTETEGRLVTLVERFVESAPRAMLFPVALPSTSYSTLLRSAREIVSVLQAGIAHRRDQPDAHDVLSTLVRLGGAAGEGLTERELIAEAYNVLCHESTASALTWAFFLLATHSHAASALADELRGVLHGGPPGPDDLARLPYLDHVIKECLRILPPAPFLRRFLAEPCEFGECVAPAGASVFFSPYVTQRIPAVFHDPRRFLPERWEACRPTTHEYFPFGLGAHACVGGAFAMLEMKIVLAMAVQHCRLDVAQGSRVDRVYKLSLRPSRGLPVVVAASGRSGTRAQVRGDIHEMVDLCREDSADGF
jgi:cytochrome P450